MKYILITIKVLTSSAGANFLFKANNFIVDNDLQPI